MVEGWGIEGWVKEPEELATPFKKQKIEKVTLLSHVHAGIRDYLSSFLTYFSFVMRVLTTKIKSPPYLP